MSLRNLDLLLNPQSVAVIGASARPGSVGTTVLSNLRQAGYAGALLPVNPKYEVIDGLPAWHSVAELPQVPDLAVICTPAATIPGLIDELGARGTRAALVLSAGLAQGHVNDDETAPTLKEAMLAAAKPYGLRILGPNCVGMLVPGIGLNASFAHTDALAGRLAFISQSGALTTAVLDWAKSKGIGFSHFISLGEAADVDFADLLDYLASDAMTQGILLYVEAVGSARKFMSAARAAARNKPVIVVKSGRVPESARAAASHSGALAAADDVFDAAIRRAGMLRVYSTEDLFTAVETLAHVRPLQGERLAIVTNGGGAGVMATDALVQGGGRLAPLAPETLTALDRLLPPTWSHGNPVDLIGDAPVERYVEAMKVLLDDPTTDAVLFIHAPTAIVPSRQIAEALIDLIGSSARNVFACWLGGDAVADARRCFAQAGIPSFDTPEDAVRGFLQVADYRRNQETLTETPPAVAEAFVADTAAARAVVQTVLAAGRRMLTEPEAKAVLSAYGIATVPTRIARTPEEAARLAEEQGFPAALKILSHDITHKSDIGGVVLDLEHGPAVQQAAEAMLRRLREHRRDARLDGFTVQPMLRRPLAFEVFVGVADDPVFGPVLLFGQGGTAVEVIRDRAVGLPPLNRQLAREMVSRTRISRLLAGYRERPAVDFETLYRTLVQVSQLVVDLPEIAELDINPLLADGSGAVALDARIGVKVPERADRLAIHPYPSRLEEQVEWEGMDIQLRPVRPEDEPLHSAFYRALSSEDIHFRFFSLVREPPHSQLARLTQIDYEREMAFVAMRKAADGEAELLGEARAVFGSDNETAEFAIVVRSDLKAKGLGSLLLAKLIRYCRERGTRRLVGEALTDNTRMVALAKSLGFKSRADAVGRVVRLELTL